MSVNNKKSFPAAELIADIGDDDEPAIEKKTINFEE